MWKRRKVELAGVGDMCGGQDFRWMVLKYVCSPVWTQIPRSTEIKSWIREEGRAGLRSEQRAKEMALYLGSPG